MTTFLIVSQRSPANPNFALKDLMGHGRFDVVLRSIIAACSPLYSNFDSIRCFLKGDEVTGWLTWEKMINNDDEVSLAHKIKIDWAKVFTQGSLDDLARIVSPQKRILLSESGNHVEDWRSLKNSLFILGAQQDLTVEDKKILQIDNEINLGKEPMLASQAIMFIRQMLDYLNTSSNGSIGSNTYK